MSVNSPPALGLSSPCCANVEVPQTTSNHGGLAVQGHKTEDAIGAMRSVPKPATTANCVGPLRAFGSPSTGSPPSRAGVHRPDARHQGGRSPPAQLTLRRSLRGSAPRGYRATSTRLTVSHDAHHFSLDSRRAPDRSSSDPGLPLKSGRCPM